MRCGSPFLVVLTLHSFARHVTEDPGDPCDAVGQLGIDWQLDVWKKMFRLFCTSLVSGQSQFFRPRTEAKTVGSLVSYFQPFSFQVWKSGQFRLR